MMLIFVIFYLGWMFCILFYDIDGIEVNIILSFLFNKYEF